MTTMSNIFSDNSLDKRICSIRVPEQYRTIDIRSTTSLNIHDMTLNDSNTKKDEWSKKLDECKKVLDGQQYQETWYIYKGLMNQYELIHVSSNPNRRHLNVAETYPLSRSYFKMWELLNDFDILPWTNVSIKTAHFAEGPGGFIEAVAKWRALHNKQAQSRSNVVRHDMYAGITLRSTRTDVPGWNKCKRILHKYPQIRLYYGKDNTGNIYRVDNIHDFVQKVGYEKCIFATGDGGLDYSCDFANQENLSFKLILCQVYGAWLVLKQGGSFVCKFFDMYESFTHEVLWLLSITFDVIHIVKPNTSRPANSERYIVAKGFRGNCKPLINYIKQVLRVWNNAHCNINRLLITTVPDSFKQIIYDYNRWYAKKQCLNILECLKFIDQQYQHQIKTNTEVSTLGRFKHNRHHVNTSLSYEALIKLFPDIIQSQIHTAVNWCKKYKVTLNTHNPYINNTIGFE